VQYCLTASEMFSISGDAVAAKDANMGLQVQDLSIKKSIPLQECAPIFARRLPLGKSDL
jgi:hypothetical protein